MKRVCLASLITFSASLPVVANEPPTTSSAQPVSNHWLETHFTAEGAPPPFTFHLGQETSAQVLQRSRREASSEKLDAHRTAHTLTWTDPTSGLQVRCAAIAYDDYPVVEWTIHLKNTAAKDSPPLTNVEAIDTTFDRRADGEFALHAFAGSTASPGDYAPTLVPLGPDAKADLHSNGYSTQENLPYFNIDWGREGAIVAVGWPGGWTANLQRNKERALQLQAGMSRLAVALKPAEEIRSPLIALLFWKGGDWIDGQNIWRHWMLDHNIPRPGGQLPKPFTATCVDGMFPGMLSNAKDEIASLENYAKHDSPLDYWWIDAGWYPAHGEWVNVGTWEPDPQRYPQGIKQVSDTVHAHGMKQVVWFEPERVTAGTWLTDNHPDWILGGKGGGLLNLGNPDAHAWVVEHFDHLLTSQGIDLYRQDYNINPADHWAHGDTDGRIGMTEMRYVEGYLSYWDELRRRHPNMLIDSCASGGRRNDLETLRRAVPLLRSDYRFEPNGTQGHNYGISFWMPFNGTGVEPAEPYVMRSHFCACFAYGGPCNDPHFDFDGRNRIAREWRTVADDILLGDYYPLADYTLSPKVWMAWQFNQAGAGRGVVQTFRRSECESDSTTLKLRGLDAAAKYELRDTDQPAAKQLTGRELMEAGLPVHLDHKSAAATIAYRKLP